MSCPASTICSLLYPSSGENVPVHSMLQGKSTIATHSSYICRVVSVHLKATFK